VAKAPRAKSAEKPVERKASARKALSFKDKHALETLPSRIQKLQATIAASQTRMADPQLYARDPAAFSKTVDELHWAEAELAAAEEQWLQLEMLREEIEGAS
jgi:ATP-binding cassette subfamily F protein uup